MSISCSIFRSPRSVRNMRVPYPWLLRQSALHQPSQEGWLEVCAHAEKVNPSECTSVKYMIYMSLKIKIPFKNPHEGTIINSLFSPTYEA
jgi:hypothetical protein